MEIQKKYNQCNKKESCTNCTSYSFCNAWLFFVQNHSDIKSYAHFDTRVSLNKPAIRSYVMDSSKVARHSFYPFIHFEKKSSRYGNKKKKKTRDLYYCSHLDRCVYQRYAFLINQKYNVRVQKDGIQDVAIAYRDDLGKNNIDFANEAFQFINNNEQCFVIVGDFTNFFDRINHQYLKEKLCDLLEVDRLPNDYYAVFKNITHFASWDWKLLVEDIGESISKRGVRKEINSKDVIMTKEEFKNNKKHICKNNAKIGIPQGSPISAVLSNVYMLDFDKWMNNYTLSRGGFYYRYSDDFLIVLPYIKQVQVEEFQKDFNDFMDSMKNLVTLQEEKTVEYIYNKGFLTSYPGNNPAVLDYLGFLYDGKKIRMRPKAITKYYYRMRRKARNIGRSNRKGKHVFAKQLYNIYSGGGEKQTFIDYAKRSKRILNLDDTEVDSVIKNHKRKIAQAVKSGEIGKN